MILANDIQNYVRDLKRGPRSKNNTRKAIKTLFTFAQTRGYLPKGLTEASDLQRVKEPAKPIGIFTPEQMAALLQHAPADLVPFLAIGAFAGLRHAEILRLDWAEVDLADGHIEILTSYRVAQVKNVAQVALEAGNSPKIIFSNYRELVKPADAEKWFSISPARPANVVMVPQPATAESPVVAVG